MSTALALMTIRPGNLDGIAGAGRYFVFGANYLSNNSMDSILPGINQVGKVGDYLSGLYCRSSRLGYNHMDAGQGYILVVPAKSPWGYIYGNARVQPLTAYNHAGNLSTVLNKAGNTITAATDAQLATLAYQAKATAAAAIDGGNDLNLPDWNGVMGINSQDLANRLMSNTLTVRRGQNVGIAATRGDVPDGVYIEVSPLLKNYLARCSGLFNIAGGRLNLAGAVTPKLSQRHQAAGCIKKIGAKKWPRGGARGIVAESCLHHVACSLGLVPEPEDGVDMQELTNRSVGYLFDDWLPLAGNNQNRDHGKFFNKRYLFSGPANPWPKASPQSWNRLRDVPHNYSISADPMTVPASPTTQMPASIKNCGTEIKFQRSFTMTRDDVGGINLRVASGRTDPKILGCSLGCCLSSGVYRGHDPQPPALHDLDLLHSTTWTTYPQQASCYPQQALHDVTTYPQRPGPLTTASVVLS